MAEGPRTRATGSGGRVAADDDDEDDAEYKAAKEKRERALGIAVVAVVIAMPILMLLLTWGALHPHEYERMFVQPKKRLNLTTAEVQEQLQAHTLLHIGGLHRSGTTLLWQGLANHSAVATLRFKPGADRRGKEWIEKVFNEGIFLQTVYPRFGLDHNKFLIKKWVGQFCRRIPYLESVAPWTRLREGVGRFALHPDHHLDEGSRLVNIPNRNLLFNQWGLLWELERPVLLEKSPSNMLIAPFLHKLWGLGVEKSPARFIFMRRHPIATAIATLTAGGLHVNDLTVTDLVENWVVAEERLKTDIEQYFDAEGPEESARVYRFLKFEHLIATPRAALSDLLEWLGLQADEEVLAQFEAAVTRDPNEKYFRRYCVRIISNEKRREEYLAMVTKFSNRILAVSDYNLQGVVDTCHKLLVAKPVGSEADDAEDAQPDNPHEEEI